MAANFKINRHSNSDNLHLQLLGDFDGSSAMELANVITDSMDRYSKIFIHTQSLDLVVDFGRVIFMKKGRAINEQHPGKLIFTGEPSESIASFASTSAAASRRSAGDDGCDGEAGVTFQPGYIMDGIYHDGRDISIRPSQETTRPFSMA